jgi:type II secretory ATPase GspE/PulE/Tfp pilus assembly ATPase PilB-like protein
VVIDGNIRGAISENRTASDLTNMLPESHLTMRHDALSKASEGITTIGEVLRATQDIDSDM